MAWMVWPWKSMPVGEALMPMFVLSVCKGESGALNWAFWEVWENKHLASMPLPLAYFYHLFIFFPVFFSSYRVKASLIDGHNSQNSYWWKGSFFRHWFCEHFLTLEGFTTRTVVKVVIEASRITTRISTGIVYTLHKIQ